MGTKKNLCDSCRFAYINCMEVAADECIDYEPQTHADRIRAMSDEELAMFLDDVQKYNIYCKPIIADDCGDCLTDLCWKCWMEWLKKEADNG